MRSFPQSCHCACAPRAFLVYKQACSPSSPPVQYARSPSTVGGRATVSKANPQTIHLTRGTVKSTVRVAGGYESRESKAVAVMKSALTQSSSVQLSNRGHWLRYKPYSKEWTASDTVSLGYMGTSAAPNTIHRPKRRSGMWGGPQWLDLPLDLDQVQQSAGIQLAGHVPGNRGRHLSRPSLLQAGKGRCRGCLVYPSRPSERGSVCCRKA